MAAVFDVFIDVGAQFQQAFLYETSNEAPIDLTGYVGKFQIRRPRDGDLLFDSDSTDIAIDGASGTVTVSMPASDTATLSWRAHAYFDILAVPADPEGTIRLVEGRVFLNPRVTL